MDTNESKKPTVRSLGKEQGASGTVIMGGIISQEEYNSDLVGKKLIRIVERMRRSDGTVKAALSAVKLPILGVEKSIQAASDDDFDQYVARFVERELKDRNIRMRKIRRESMTHLDFGYCVFEKTYEVTEFEGQVRIGFKSIDYRKQTTIMKWETQDGKPGITQQLNIGTASIIEPKLVIFTNEQEGENYEGISILRAAYKDWKMKSDLEIIDAIGGEKMALGVPRLKPPLNANPEDQHKARDAVMNMRANESSYLEIPEGWDVEMMDMKANTTKELMPSIRYHAHQITLSVLTQFLMLGSDGSSGSRALSEDHSALLRQSVETIVSYEDEVWNDQVIKQLCDLNFSDLPNGYPKMTSGRVSDDDIKDLSTALKGFKDAGLLTPTFETEQHVRKIAHLPELPAEFEEEYERRHQQPDTVPGKDAPKPSDDTSEKNADDLPENDDVKASALAAAKQARRRIIEVLYEG